MYPNQQLFPHLEDGSAGDETRVGVVDDERLVDIASQLLLHAGQAVQRAVPRAPARTASLDPMKSRRRRPRPNRPASARGNWEVLACATAARRIAPSDRLLPAQPRDAREANSSNVKNIIALQVN